MGICFIFETSLGHSIFFDLNLKHCPALSLKMVSEELDRVG